MINILPKTMIMIALGAFAGLASTVYADTLHLKNMTPVDLEILILRNHTTFANDSQWYNLRGLPKGGKEYSFDVAGSFSRIGIKRPGETSWQISEIGSNWAEGPVTPSNFAATIKAHYVGEDIVDEETGEAQPYTGGDITYYLVNKKSYG